MFKSQRGFAGSRFVSVLLCRLNEKGRRIRAARANLMRRRKLDLILGLT